MNKPAFRAWTQRLAFVAVASAVSCFGSAAPAKAEIEKIMRVCEGENGGVKLCPIFRPSFKGPEGWSVDSKTEAKQGIIVFVPPGKTFGNAPALIVSDARYNSEKLPLGEWISNSDRRWIAAKHGSKIVELPNGDLGAGKREVVVRRYENPSLKGQPIELVGYFADTDKEGNSYVVRLTLTGLQNAEVEATRPLFDAMLKNY